MIHTTMGYYSIADVAKLFQVSEATVRRWIKIKRLEAVKVKRRWWMSKLHLETFLRQDIEHNQTLWDPKFIEVETSYKRCPICSLSLLEEELVLSCSQCDFLMYPSTTLEEAAQQVKRYWQPWISSYGRNQLQYLTLQSQSKKAHQIVKISDKSGGTVSTLAQEEPSSHQELDLRDMGWDMS